MKLTREEKNEIRQHWSYLKLRFKPDGTVLAAKPVGQGHFGAWGLLYNPEDTFSHLAEMKATGLPPRKRK